MSDLFDEDGNMRALKAICAKCRKEQCECTGEFVEYKAEPYGVELPMNERPWHVRIPAAIAKAEELLGGGLPHGVESTLQSGVVTIACRGSITATEVALAKALWERNGDALDYHIQEFCGNEPSCVAKHAEIEEPPEALRDFTEKAESLEGAS